jgi:hypothetical protein
MGERHGLKIIRLFGVTWRPSLRHESSSVMRTQNRMTWRNASSR